MKQRIEWIDTAKGIAILLVVLEHTTSLAHTHIGIMFTNIRMPLYFVLSGLFFKTYGNSMIFLQKKINNLIIPTLFFFWGACLVYFCLHSVGVRFEIPFRWTYILDIFRPTEEIYCNGVVWFLISLFWVNCLFYIASSFLNGKILCIILIFSGLISVFGVKFPYFFDTSLTAMPLFYIGRQLKQWNVLTSWKYDKYLLLIAFACLLIVALLAEDNSMRTNRYDSPYLYHITAICGVIGILALCKKIGCIPLLSSLYGRYSLIVLGTHSLLINPIRRFSLIYFNGNGLFTFTIVTLAELAVIPLFVKMFPYFCAQKSIFGLFSKTRL